MPRAPKHASKQLHLRSWGKPRCGAPAAYPMTDSIDEVQCSVCLHMVKQEKENKEAEAKAKAEEGG